MLSFTKKQQMGILIVGIILIFILGQLKGKSSGGDYYDDFEKVSTEELLESDRPVDDYADTEEREELTDVTVYIKGAVSKPGIVTLESGKRVIDVVERAGGFLESADVEQVNLARKVQDEEMIHIPRVGEELGLGGDQASAGLNRDSSLSTEGSPNSARLVNINTASQEELKTLSGIGDATAEKIIQHRESSPFSKIEDIMDVSGIGEKKFEAIRDSIVVN